MIRKANIEDLLNIQKIYQIARAYMRDNGNKTQWEDGYPCEELLKSDIQKGQLYVIMEDMRIHGVFAFILGEDPTYRNIEDGSWKNDNPYGTIHRIASDGQVKKMFEQCLNYCITQIDNIRIDTHRDNKTMQHLIEKNGFEQCGIIYIADGSSRIAYQYTNNIADQR